MLKIYHNNRCSKSRQTLDLIRKSGQEVEVVEYLKTVPTADELQEVLQKLRLKPSQLLRKGERVFKELYAGQVLSEEEWLQVLLKHPVLLERPIVVSGERALIGRPPENVLPLLSL